MPPDFRSDAERTAWIVENADYWTVIRRRNLRNEREEFPTRDEAEGWALAHLTAEPDARYMIYAVAGIYSTFVTSILCK